MDKVADVQIADLTIILIFALSLIIYDVAYYI